MHIGLALPHYDTSLAGRPVSWEGVKEAALVAENSGFDSVWVSDHLFLDWGKYGGSDDPQGALECWTTLSALAAVTQRVRIGSLTLCNDLRNPGLLAKMVATLALLSGGRLEVGLGAGWYEPEYTAAGVPFDRPGARIGRLGEALQVLKLLLEGDEVAFEGRYYTMDGAICRPFPDERPRLWVGGKGDHLLKTVVRYADGWNFSWLGDIATYEGRLEVALRICEEEGRDPATLARSVGAYVLIGRDDSDVRKRFERLVEVTPAGVLRGGSSGGAVSFEEFRRRGFVGTVEEVRDRIGRLHELEVEELVVGAGVLPFQVADLDDVEFIGSELGRAI